MEDGTISRLSSPEGTDRAWPDDYLDGIYRGEYDPEICPVRHVLKGIADKWTILILAGLKADRQRFSQIKRLVPDVSQRMLTQTLRKLERDGYVTREVTPSIPPRVDYELTDLGRSLVAQLAPLARWADEHRDMVGHARTRYDQANGHSDFG
ncbi:winged helix-turn-helix transcriptional regulator [Novosphingobium aquimarinum]|jgi:DNA-binding HxlR family transcriptional regulator|uniref:winged helix-turn-helix transcriptional regulator n=1 Tax=Novosphingobium aquimarinum TaxID=2682494 RepID=UPI0012EBA447|nr:helix-turn-helix domain-containing protein [Novosphingobium aquimarinum]